MKKRLLMIIATMLCVATLFAACGAAEGVVITNVSQAKSAYSSCMKNVKAVTTDIEYKDGSFVIKKVNRKQSFTEGNEVSVVTRTTAIDSTTFGESTSETRETKTIERNSLVAFNLSENLLLDFTCEGGVLSGTVSDDNVEKFLGKKLDCFGGIRFSATFEGANIQTAEYSFKFIVDGSTGKMCEAFVSVAYEY